MFKKLTLWFVLMTIIISSISVLINSCGTRVLEKETPAYEVTLSEYKLLADIMEEYGKEEKVSNAWHSSIYVRTINLPKGDTTYSAEISYYKSYNIQEQYKINTKFSTYSKTIQINGEIKLPIPRFGAPLLNLDTLIPTYTHVQLCEDNVLYSNLDTSTQTKIRKYNRMVVDAIFAEYLPKIEAKNAAEQKRKQEILKLRAEQEEKERIENEKREAAKKARIEACLSDK